MIRFADEAERWGEGEGEGLGGGDGLAQLGQAQDGLSRYCFVLRSPEHVMCIVHPVVPGAAQVAIPDFPETPRAWVLGHPGRPPHQSPSPRTRVRALPGQEKKEGKC